MAKREPWNRCDECGRFIAFDDFEPRGKAVRYMILPDSDCSTETYQTLCAKDASKRGNGETPHHQ